MRKLIKRMVLCFAMVVMVWCGTLLADRQKLNEELIRLHVVANSDSEEDQAIKLRVRDVITESIQSDLEKMVSREDAFQYLQENLPKLQQLANQVLQEAGVSQDAVVTLCKEAFDTREYDTFSLPAGVYQALRITIGTGEGKNWWCVAFPTLCQSATTAAFSETAVQAGLSQDLTDSLSGQDNYEIRFFLLDAMGKLENKLFGK